MPGVGRVASAAPGVSDAQMSKAGLVITAKQAGTTIVRAWKKGEAEPEPIAVEVHAAGWALVTLLVAARDLPEGTVLAAADVTLASLPRAVVTSSVSRAGQQNDVLAHRALVPIQAGDVLWWAAFASKTR